MHRDGQPQVPPLYAVRRMRQMQNPEKARAGSSRRAERQIDAWWHGWGRKEIIGGIGCMSAGDAMVFLSVRYLTSVYGSEAYTKTLAAPHPSSRGPVMQNSEGRARWVVGVGGSSPPPVNQTRGVRSLMQYQIFSQGPASPFTTKLIPPRIDQPFRQTLIPFHSISLHRTQTPPLFPQSW